MDFSETSSLTDKERFQLDYLLKRDPLYEFFNLTCQSSILNSPYINSICHIETKQLYVKVLKDGIPFHRWATWVEDFLNAEFFKLALSQGGTVEDFTGDNPANLEYLSSFSDEQQPPQPKSRSGFLSGLMWRSSHKSHKK